MSVIHHRLPSDSPDLGDETWFSRLNAFERAETARQAQFKRRHWPNVPDGERAGPRDTVHRYPYVLPHDHAYETLWPEIREPVQTYFRACDIALHREAANLRSSQICCLNFLFPLKANLDQAAQALAPLLSGVSQVTSIEFEYTGPEAATQWLGEPPGGRRGANRTSADAAFWWRDTHGRRLTLVEWKYTERQFGTCGGFASRGNVDKRDCHQWPGGTTPTERNCYLESGGSDRVQRHYWEHLTDAGITLATYQGRVCPFRGAFYQLLRLHLLAAFLSQQRGVERVDVAVVHFRGNTSLRQSRDGDVIRAWQGLLADPDHIRACAAEELAGALRGSGALPSLAEYLGERYGV